MAEEIERFTPAGEKIISHELTHLVWSNHMDLVAIITKENLLEVFRISYKNQKVFQAEETNSITHCAFSPDSKLFVYFMDNGTYKIVKTENGEMMFHVKPKTQPNQLIVSSSWVAFNQVNKLEKINPFKKYAMLDNLIPQLGPHIHADKHNLSRLSFFNETINSFNLIVTNDNQGNVQVNLNGVFQLAKFQLSDFFPQQIKLETSQFVILQSFVRANSETISFLVSARPAQNKTRPRLFVIDLEMNSFYFMKDSISRVGYLLSFIEEHMQYMKTTFNSVLQQLKDIQKIFNLRISGLEDCINNHSSNAAHASNSKPITEFMTYLTTGNYSSALHHYFGKELFDSKALQKMDETIYNTFTSIQEFLLESILNTLERLTVLLTSLQNSATQGYHHAFFGIDAEMLQRIIHLVSELYVRSDKFLKEVTETKINTRNLIVWMNKCVIKTSGDAEIENTKSPLNKLSFDIRRLIKIFEDEDVFYMRHLMTFFNEATTNVFSPTSFDQGLKSIFTEINNLTLQNQKRDGLQDALEEHCLSSLEKQFADLQNDVLDPSLNILDSRVPKKLDTGLSNVFRRSEEHSFKYLLQNIEDSWKVVMSRPSETLRKTFRLKNIFYLGEFASIGNNVALSPQEITDDAMAIAFATKLGQSDCLISLKSDSKNQLFVSIVELKGDYDLKELVVWQNNSVLVLMTSNEHMTNDRAHSIVGLIDTSSLEGITSTRQGLYTDFMEILKSNQTVLATNPLEYSKFFRIDSTNVSKLKASLKGLISVLVDDSKIMFFVE